MEKDLKMNLDLSFHCSMQSDRRGYFDWHLQSLNPYISVSNPKKSIYRSITINRIQYVFPKEKYETMING